MQGVAESAERLTQLQEEAREEARLVLAHKMRMLNRLMGSHNTILWVRFRTETVLIICGRCTSPNILFSPSTASVSNHARDTILPKW